MGGGGGGGGDYTTIPTTPLPGPEYSEYVQMNLLEPEGTQASYARIECLLICMHIFFTNIHRVINNWNNLLRDSRGIQPSRYL